MFTDYMSNVDGVTALLVKYFVSNTTWDMWANNSEKLTEEFVVKRHQGFHESLPCWRMPSSSVKGKNSMFKGSNKAR